MDRSHTRKISYFIVGTLLAISNIGYSQFRTDTIEMHDYYSPEKRFNQQRVQFLVGTGLIVSGTMFHNKVKPIADGYYADESFAALSVCLLFGTNLILHSLSNSKFWPERLVLFVNK